MTGSDVPSAIIDNFAKYYFEHVSYDIFTETNVYNASEACALIHKVDPRYRDRAAQGVKQRVQPAVDKVLALTAKPSTMLRWPRAKQTLVGPKRETLRRCDGILNDVIHDLVDPDGVDPKRILDLLELLVGQLNRHVVLDVVAE